MYINIKTGFSFRSVFGHTKDIIQHCKDQGSDFAGMADINNTFGHISFQKSCREQGIKPILGVCLPVFYNMDRIRRAPENIMTFIALNIDGLREIYRLVDLAHRNFYYKPRISHFDVNSLSNNIVVLSGVSPDLSKLHHDNLYLQLSPETPLAIRDIKTIPSIACCDNFYINPEDWKVYEAFADDRLRDKKTTIQYIPSYEEFLHIFPHQQLAIDNLLAVASKIDFSIEKAPMVKSIDNENIKSLCIIGAGMRGISLLKGKYKKRYKRELQLIEEKDYIDYFLVVADLVKYAKTKMTVGHARGSSAGSLICYLLGITEVDPIKYGLYFERFIDINRDDLPDIDIDFQDNKRHLIISYLKKKYGEDNVAQIGNISRLKSKSSIIRFAKALRINLGDIEELKDSIVGGTIKEALQETEAGKTFIKQFPNMKDVHRIEEHPSHSSVHAAGILVSTKPISDYCGINSREKQRIAMLDKRDAEEINLLKIDALGLRTLTILADICDQLKKPYTWLYDITMDDKKTYQMFNDHRYNGVFQFEGEAATNFAKKMQINCIEDISAIIALCRPGPSNSGGSNRYMKRRSGKSKVKYLDPSKAFIKATKATYGVLVYQEQVMQIAKDYAGLSWPEVSKLRKAIGKKKGIEESEKLFIKSAKKQGHKKQNIKAIWKEVETHGAYSFNLSHSISYAIISYLTAYFKAHYPLEFTVASLNHAKDDVSALKFLRDMVENEGIKYNPFHPKKSEKNWTSKKGKLYGGILSLNGIGPANANKFISLRSKGEYIPAGIQKHINNCDTPFKYLYPAKQLYGEYYNKGRFNQKCREIKDIHGRANWIFIGQLIKKNIRDMNEPALVIKRGGDIQESPTTFLQIVIEDDTDSIFCSIWPDMYEEIGKEISELGRENKDWYLIEGTISSNQFRGINIEEIRKITK
jgi:DNA-directed DNA polymerase III PolC